MALRRVLDSAVIHSVEVQGSLVELLSRSVQAQALVALEVEVEDSTQVIQPQYSSKFFGLPP